MTNERKPSEIDDLYVLDMLRRILADHFGATSRWKVHKRAKSDEFFALEFKDGRVFNITVQETEKENE